MSDAVFPDLPGKMWDWVKRPTFRNEIFRSMSAREVRLAMMAYPLWEFELSYGVLRDDYTTQAPAAPYDELKNLVGFFLARGGSFDSFLFDDTTDDSVTDQLFGTGNASATQFQLVRAYGGFAEPVQNVEAITNVKVAGVIKNPGTDYTVNSTGLVTFNSPPAGGANVSWTGTYYYRCRFMEDKSDFQAFMLNLFGNKKMSFVGAPGNKL